MVTRSDSHPLTLSPSQSMWTPVAFAVLTSPMLLIAQTLTAPIIDAQAPRAVTLGKPVAELHDTFTSMSSVRELSDGRVIVSDRRDNLVQLADFKTQKLTKIGREGSGPAEYESAGSLYALLNDTTLLGDFANKRFMIINPDGKAGATRTDDEGSFVASSTLGLDERGATYLAVRFQTNKGEGGPQYLIRYEPRTKHADTITSIVRPSGLVSGASSTGNGMLKYFTNLPFAPEDVAAVARDGRVAVARFDNYHVEWFARDGKKTIGPTVQYSPIAIDAAEKRAFLEKQVRPGTILVQNKPGATSAPMSSGPRKAVYNAETYDDKGMTWPARKPPFVANALSIDPAGRAWVLRTTPHTAPGLTYDVFDSAAKLILSVTIPPKTKVVGFGAKSVYLAFTDDDDLQHLHRYAAPQ